MGYPNPNCSTVAAVAREDLLSFPDLIDSIPEKVDNCKDVCKDQLCVFFDKTDLRTGNIV